MARGSVDTLWIPEKPNVARQLVEALCRVRRASLTNRDSAGKEGIFRLSSGDVVCSVFGHMLTMLPPSRYLTREQNAAPMEVLPLIPNPFKFEPKSETDKEGKVRKGKDGKPMPARRFEQLRDLILQAKTLVNACDIDREGQLIFDELVRFVGRDPYAPDVKRTSIVSMTEEALDEAVRAIEPNNDPKWMRRGASAETRQKMDWLLGMNASMAYQVVTGVRTMSVGRVQTPVLAIVVLRDMAIESFKPQAYYVPVIIMADGTRLKWELRHGAENQPGFDPNGRIIDPNLARAIVAQIQSGLAGEVSAAKIEDKSEAPPLPFSMGSLQSGAAKAHGLSVAEVTKAAQNLYEKHKAITYVGTDCRFLPEAMHEKGYEIIAALAEQFKVVATGANPKIKSKAFSDAKMGDSEHYAIIPTGVMPHFGPSERAERGVFETISKRYLAQFYPDHKYQTAAVAMRFGDDEFRASSKRVLENGWRDVEGDQESGAAKTRPTGEAPVHTQVQKAGAVS